MVMRRLCSTRPTGVNTRRQPCPDEGFTIVELLITLALLGIVTAIAIPSLRGWIDNMTLKDASRTISSSFYDTRARAISESRTYTITYNTNPPYTYTIAAPAVGLLPLVNEIRNLSEFRGVRITGIPAGQITIQSRGIVSPAGTVVLTNGRNSTGTINVLITGRSHVTYSMQ
jgi:type IV fimbrial biogenesis protein FimT